MDDPSVLITAIEHGQWEIAAGLLLLAVVTVARLYLEPRLEDPAAAWVSAIAGVLGAAGVALAAGAVWWHALLLSLLAAGPSAGLWRLLADLCVPRGQR